MKPLLCLCLAAPMAFSLTATAVSTSPTQAILSYTAPSDNACTVEISESPTYLPPVHDVDASLFAGSNLDSRSGALPSGPSRLFLAGTRSIEPAGDGRKYSRALQQGTKHYYRVTCDGNVASGTFTTRSAPFGSTYADLPPLNSDGTPSSPATSTTSRSEVIIDPQTGVAVSHVNLPSDECTGCGLAGSYRGSRAGGFGQWCSDNLSAQGNYHCLIPGGWGWNANLYAINPTTGAATFLGAAYYHQVVVDPAATSVAGMMGPGNEVASFDPNDAHGNTIYNQLIIGTTGRSTLVKWIYTGNDQYPSAPWTNEDPVMAPGTPVDMLGGADLNDLAHAFNSAFDKTKYACQIDELQSHYAMFHCYRGQQGSAAWEGVYDIGNGKPLGSGGNGAVVALTLLHANAPTRWCTDHSFEYLGSNTAIKSTATDPFNGQAIGDSEYQVILGTSIDGYPNVQPGTTQTISVSSSSLINGHNSGCSDTWTAPAGWSDGEPLSACQDHFLQATQVGDILQLPTNEVIQITAKHSPTSWDIKRGILAGQGWPYPAPALSGATMNMYCQAGADTVTGGNMGYDWWDFMASPDGSNPADNIVQYGNHPVSRQNKRFDSTYLWGPGPVTDKTTWGITPPYSIFTQTTFAGTTPNEGGNTYQKHPSMASGVDSYVYDSTYFVGGNAFSDNTGWSNPMVVTPVAGTTHVYRYNPFTGNSVAHAINPKTVPTLAKTQSQYLVDVSGPGRILTDADDYAWCYAYAAGECASGSSAGQIYFSMSTLNPSYRYCSGGEDKPNVQDICIGPFDSMGLAAMQYKLSTTNSGLWRTLTRLFTGSAIIDPTHLGEFAVAVNYASGPAANVWLLKIPPDPGSDGIDRTNYVPATLNLTTPGGLGAASARVKFWYAEHGGTAAQPYCTSRREGCVAVASTIDKANPFFYATSDKYSPASCSSKCTITIPVTPLHTAYFSVEYLNAGGEVVSTMPGLAMENAISSSASSAAAGAPPVPQQGLFQGTLK